MSEQRPQRDEEAALEEAASKLKKLLKLGDLDQAHRLASELSREFPSNENLKKALLEIERRKRLLQGNTPKERSLKQLSCPACAHPLRIRNEEAELITCPSCSAALELSSEGVELGETLSNSKLPPRSFISLGDTAEFDSQKYQVIGRICYSSRAKEWDPEDREYYTEDWSWEEWTLVGEKKNYLYLTEDAEGYSISKAITPTSPGIPKPGESYFTLFKETPPQRILEDGFATIQHLEGEFTWIPKLGDRLRYCEYRLGLTSYSVEVSVDRITGQNREIEFFSSLPIERLEVARAFGASQIVAEEEAKIAAKEEAKRWSSAFFLGSALLLLLAAFSCIRPGELKAKYVFPSESITTEGAIQGPFKLDEKGAYCSISISTNIPAGARNWNNWFGLELLDREQASLNTIEGDFWREEGRDDEGYWSESSTTNSLLFRLEHPGEFYIRVFREIGTGGLHSALTVEIREGLGLSRYYILGGIFCLIYGAAIRKYRSLNPIYLIAGIFAFVGIIFVMIRENSD